MSVPFPILVGAVSKFSMAGAAPFGALSSISRPQMTTPYTQESQKRAGMKSAISSEVLFAPQRPSNTTIRSLSSTERSEGLPIFLYRYEHKARTRERAMAQASCRIHDRLPPRFKLGRLWVSPAVYFPHRRHFSIPRIIKSAILAHHEECGENC